MLELLTDIIALVMNPISLLLFLIAVKYMRKDKKKSSNDLWARHQGRGA